MAATLEPNINAYSVYAPAGSPPEAGFQTEGFNASFGKLRRQSGTAERVSRLLTEIQASSYYSWEYSA